MRSLRLIAVPLDLLALARPDDAELRLAVQPLEKVGKTHAKRFA